MCPIEKKYRSLLFKNLDFPERYKKSSLDNYAVTTDAQKNIIDFLKSYDFKTNLLFTGLTGTGKTHFAYALMRKFVLEHQVVNDNCIDNLKRGYEPKIANNQVFYVKFTKLTKININDYDLYNRMIKSEFLIIDEVGRSMTDFKNELLFDCLNDRWDLVKPTMLITNLTPNDFKKSIEDAIFSRIKENYKAFDCTWDDYRLSSGINAH